LVSELLTPNLQAVTDGQEIGRRTRCRVPKGVQLADLAGLWRPSNAFLVISVEIFQKGD
jgi:hypothetical protein